MRFTGDIFHKTPEIIRLDARLADNEAAWDKMIKRGDTAAMRAYMEAHGRLIAERKAMIRDRMAELEGSAK